MKIVFIRHGEPRYDNVANYNLVSYLGELTPSGILQAEAVAIDSRLNDSEVIISSPFTRAIQTAAIISRKTNIPILVEPAFHEWLSDVTHVNASNEVYTKNSYKEFLTHHGIRTDDCVYNWESVSEIALRSYPAMKKYIEQYNKIIVVAHAMFMRTFGYKLQEMNYCTIFERDFDYNSSFKYFVPYSSS